MRWSEHPVGYTHATYRATYDDGMILEETILVRPTVEQVERKALGRALQFVGGRKDLLVRVDVVLYKKG